MSSPSIQNAGPESLTTLPPPWPEDLLPDIRRRVKAANRTMVVLDDDPTGTQTVHDTPVLTDWSPERITAEFQRGDSLFYILTNSRSLPASDAAELNRGIARSLLAARAATGRDFAVISRSDSTLRGHYPLETDVLAETLDLRNAVCLVIPFFLEGGRLTVDDVHHVVEGDRWTRASETPFAKDAVFGFSTSHLREWVEEKTEGRHPAKSVGSLGLERIRQGPAAVLEALRRFPPGSVAVVNALVMRDLEVVVSALLEAEAHGQRFLYRTAASFVRARAGLEARPLLEPCELIQEGSPQGGLTIVGSHVPKTTQQLRHLLNIREDLHLLELDVPAILENRAPVKTAVRELDRQLDAGRSCVVFTSRQVISADSPSENLRIAQAVSQALTDLLRQLSARPRYLIAKGGITASDLATRGLGMSRAIVRGQILPGVPVWEPDAASRFPGLPYVVFPGNVGGEDALLQAVAKLEGSRLT